MKKLLLIAGAFLLITAGCKKEEEKNNPAPPASYTEKDIYYYSYTSISDSTKKVKISAYKGKKILFVNTASYCVNTPQYAKLQQLYSANSSKLVIIGFPCNQFNSQEPGSNDDIQDFCSGYGVTFPMSRKIDVKGTNQDPVYRWLTTKSYNGKLDSDVAWNFQKYLVDEKGTFMYMFPNDMEPDDPAMISAISE
jgi:glutathione peroxidase